MWWWQFLVRDGPSGCAACWCHCEVCPRSGGCTGPSTCCWPWRTRGKGWERRPRADDGRKGCLLDQWGRPPASTTGDRNPPGKTKHTWLGAKQKSINHERKGPSSVHALDISSGPQLVKLMLIREDHVWDNYNQHHTEIMPFWLKVPRFSFTSISSLFSLSVYAKVYLFSVCQLLSPSFWGNPVPLDPVYRTLSQYNIQILSNSPLPIPHPWKNFRV